MSTQDRNKFKARAIIDIKYIGEGKLDLVELTQKNNDENKDKTQTEEMTSAIAAQSSISSDFYRMDWPNIDSLLDDDLFSSSSDDFLAEPNSKEYMTSDQVQNKTEYPEFSNQSRRQSMLETSFTWEDQVTESITPHQTMKKPTKANITTIAITSEINVHPNTFHPYQPWSVPYQPFHVTSPMHAMMGMNTESQALGCIIPSINQDPNFNTNQMNYNINSHSQINYYQPIRFYPPMLYSNPYSFYSQPLYTSFMNRSNCSNINVAEDTAYVKQQDTHECVINFVEEI